MNIDRIHEMESRLERTESAVAALNAQLQRLKDMRGTVTALFNYYGSEAWYADRESPLPAGTKAGVLSEDQPYDAITDLRDAAFRMLTLGTDILKNWI